VLGFSRSSQDLISTEGAGFEPAETFTSPVFKTEHIHCYDWVLGGLCLGFCLHNVELCRRSRPESTRFGSSASPWWPCSYGVTSEWCGMKHPPVEIGRIHLDWARHRKAPVGDGSPSACHGSAVACIGQPPPPSAPGPVWGWRAGPLSRGCGGRAAGSRRGVGVGPHLSSRDCAAPVDSERIRLHWL